ncbi:hypothetical protein K6119_17035 [Paracrocinitomix mangrovi]|uniref:hypothetical protein n=1 Tax=Paracrocinitomix mangrovi TaxID=2862509 RepID=UPI001C8E1083|nr:hypothetical protein [Paracrocinitomix mangrovi]UKN01432.1 hypothetical protein K6119_17035 [Paracrocinitomix mangrovi]
MNNDSLDYEVFKIKGDDSSEVDVVSSSQHIIKMDILKSDSLKLANMSYTKWESYLKNNQTSWNANLILYWLYKKDGVWFFYDGVKSNWYQNQMKGEVEDWLFFLRKLKIE